MSAAGWGGVAICRGDVDGGYGSGKEIQSTVDVGCRNESVVEYAAWTLQLLQLHKPLCKLGRCCANCTCFHLGRSISLKC